MFFRKKRAENERDEDAKLSELDEVVGGGGNLTDGIQKALERTDLTAEDRLELQAALKRIKEQNPPE